MIINETEMLPDSDGEAIKATKMLQEKMKIEVPWLLNVDKNNELERKMK